MGSEAFFVSAFNSVAVQSPLLSGMTVFFAEYFPYAIAGLFLWFAITRVFPPKKRLSLVVEGFGSALLARAGVEVIRIFIHRPRPFVADPSIIALISESSFSFPSGHASFFFAVSTVVFLHDKRWGVCFYIASALIGIARVVAGVHYPSDILGGIVLGVLIGLFVHSFTQNLTKKKTVF